MVLASHNPHKAEELTRLLDGFEIEPYTGSMPPETGSTFRENALIKARHVHRRWVRVCGWWPMIRASSRPRWGERRGSTRHALPEPMPMMRQTSRSCWTNSSGHHDRRVSYVAELVAVDPEGREFHGRGELRGTLADAPPWWRRDSGMTRRSSLRVKLRTVGEMSAAEKDAISHRARAADALQRAIQARLSRFTPGRPGLAPPAPAPAGSCRRPSTS